MLHYKIFCGNSNSVPAIENNSVHMIFTSPPYAIPNLISYDSSNPENIGNYEKEEYLELMKPVYKECFRILKSGRKIIVNIADPVDKSTIDNKAGHYRMANKTVNLLEEIGFIYEDTIIWNKMQSVGFHTNVSSRPGSSVLTHKWEYLFLFRRPGETDWSHLTDQDRKTGELSSEFIGKYLFNMWDVISESQKTFHPAPFPLQLPKIGIRLFTFPNEIVYDPFLGTGTTIKAAMELQRSAYGTELGYTPTKIEDGIRIPDGTNWLDRTKAEINWGTSNLASDEILWRILKTTGEPIEQVDVKGLGKDKLMEESLHSKGQNLLSFGLELPESDSEKKKESILPQGDGEWKNPPEVWVKQKKIF